MPPPFPAASAPSNGQISAAVVRIHHLAQPFIDHGREVTTPPHAVWGQVLTASALDGRSGERTYLLEYIARHPASRHHQPRPAPSPPSPRRHREQPKSPASPPVASTTGPSPPGAERLPPPQPPASKGFTQWTFACGATLCYTVATVAMAWLVQRAPVGLIYAVWTGAASVALVAIDRIRHRQLLHNDRRKRPHPATGAAVTAPRGPYPNGASHHHSAMLLRYALEGKYDFPPGVAGLAQLVCCRRVLEGEGGRNRHSEAALLGESGGRDESFDGLGVRVGAHRA